MKRLMALLASVIAALALAACETGTSLQTVEQAPTAATAASPAATPSASSGATSATTQPDRSSGTKAPQLPTTTPAPLDPALRAMLQAVAEARHLPVPADLKTTFIKRADLPELLDELLTDDDRRWFAETTTLYRLLGHLRADQDYLSVYQSFGSDAILGLYSPVHDEMWVVYDGDTAPALDRLPAGARTTLLHELVHALQDASFALDKVYAGIADNLDRNLAWSAVVEGDAVTHERLAARRLTAPGSGLAFMLGDLAQARDVPQSIQRELYFPYTTGADWVADIVREKGTGAIDALLQEPPAGTSLILHPELLDQGWQPLQVDLPSIAAKLGQDWRRESGGTLGEFHLRNYLQLQLRSSEAAAAAAGWVGDAYAVYVDGDGSSRQSAAVFRLRFTNATEASAFASAQRAFYSAARASFGSQGGVTTASVPGGPSVAFGEVRGDEVVFALGSTRAVAVAALAALAQP